MQKYVFESKNKEVSLEKVLEELNVKEDDVLYKSSEEKSGLFSKKFSLEVVKLSDVAEYGKELLNELLNLFGKTAKIEKKIRNKTINYDVVSKDNSILIGKNGHILNSIQTYIRQVIFNDIGMFVNIQIDVEGYKDKQKYFLVKNVKRIARDVTLSKGMVKLDPMNSYDRRIVHDALKGFKYIKSDSEGTEPNRYVVIKYVENKEEN